ncbi:Lsr2 family protein [Kocuria sp. CPCC 205300]|uniref:histone-like nucleoid-structuring protein Lsr2 n=1 Tax=Kocuria sabuli TaxID=3071448 RepID=UPI0036DE8744
MAQNVQILLTDDIDGSEAAETVRFGLDGKDYEIDLSTTNAEQLREALAPYSSAARKVASNAGARSTSRTSQGSGNGETAAIRVWAKANGYEVSDRGRIHQHIKDAYEAAQKADA